VTNQCLAERHFGTHELCVTHRCRRKYGLTDPRLIARDAGDTARAALAEEQPGRPGQQPASAGIDDQRDERGDLQRRARCKLGRPKQTGEWTDEDAGDRIDGLRKPGVGVSRQRAQEEADQEQTLDQTKHQIDGLHDSDGVCTPTSERIVSGRHGMVGSCAS